LTLSRLFPISTVPARRALLRPGPIISLLIIALASLVGAATAATSEIGRTSPGSASREWLFLLVVVWILLLGWALLYAAALNRWLSLTPERSLFLAALSHVPLLAPLALLAQIYGSDLVNHVYFFTAYTDLVFRPAVRGYLLLTPAVAQLVVGLACRPRVLIRLLSPALGIALLALVLRAWHLDWGFPGQFHPDEAQYVGKALQMLMSGDMHPYQFKNPSLMTYATYLVFVALTPQIESFHHAARLFEWNVVDPRGDLLLTLGARMISVSAGSLTVVLVYLTGRDMFGRRAAILAALILAVSLLHVRNSHYATNDMLATMFLAASFLFSARVLSQGGASNYLMSGLLGGLAVSTKYNAGVFVAALLAAHLMRVARTGGWKDAVDMRHHLILSAAVLASAFAFAIGTPYAVMDPHRFAADFWTQFSLGGEGWYGQQDEPSLLLFLKTLVQGFGLAPLILSAAAFLIARPSARWQLALIAAVPLLYLAFMSTQKLFFARFAIPLLPFLALLAGYSIQRAADFVRRPAWREALILLLVAAAVTQPLALTLRHITLLGEPDTREMAANWVSENVPPEASIAVEVHAGMNYPFGWRGNVSAKENPSYFWLRGVSVFWPERKHEADEVLLGKYDYVIVSSYGYAAPAANGADSPRAFYQALNSKGRLVASFSAVAAAEAPYSLDDVYSPFWHLHGRASPGPTVRIYQMGRGSYP
jgi:4-amino-4-deoxy-L-arabinose transferase-like glycosyltransferase